MLKKALEKRVFRFIICGAITAAFNTLLLTGMIELLKLEQPILRNIANIASIEISLLFSFLIYRAWVWSGGKWTLKEVFRRQFPLYHLSCGAAVVTRSLVLFPVLDWLGVNYQINNLIGILIGSSINYVASDRIVFKAKKQRL